MATYILPVAPEPVYDKALEDIFQGVVKGIVGLPGNLIRPRWQQDPPNLPSYDASWIAFGLTIGPKQWDAYKKFDTAANAYVVEGSEAIVMAASFYGPQNEALHRKLEDGLQLDLNRADLEAQKIKYIGAGDPVNLPALLKEMWYLRVDVSFAFSRWVRRVYPIDSINSAAGSIKASDAVGTDPLDVSLSVTPPTP